MVLAALLKTGRTVLVPFGSLQHYDLVMEDGGCFFRVQRKTGRLRQGAVRFNLYTMAQEHGSRRHICQRYDDRVDFYGVYCPETGKVYLVPSAAVCTSKALGVLRVSPPANNQAKGIRWASEYEL